MKVNLAETLRNLRREKGVSQEKLAAYLGVSFQAVSKWETGGGCPDISLLPEIACFYGITVDELLQVEKLDEQRLYESYRSRAHMLFRNGKRQEALSLWQEAYHKMPNNTEVREMLMSSYYDVDKVKYRDEIVELGMEIYNSNASSYYKGQAIREIMNVHAACGQAELADQWAGKSYPIHSARDILYTQIHDGDELLADVSFCTYWFFCHMFYMAVRINGSKTVPADSKYKMRLLKTLITLYETLFPDGDMEFEQCERMRTLYILLAERAIELGQDETAVRSYLEGALSYVEKSLCVKEHTITAPFLYGWKVLEAPTDNRQWARLMKKDLAEHCCDPYRDKEWFAAMEARLDSIL